MVFKKSTSLFLFLFPLCFVARIYFVVNIGIPVTNLSRKNVFSDGVELQACPPPSQSPNCPTPVSVPSPTKVQVSPINNTPVPSPASPHTDSSDSDELRKRHETQTALAYIPPAVTLTSTTVSQPSTGVGTLQSSKPTTQGQVSQSSNTPLSTPEPDPPHGGNTFIIVTIILVFGIIIAAVLVTR